MMWLLLSYKRNYMIPHIILNTVYDNIDFHFRWKALYNKGGQIRKNF
jgi:hypothetical protein